MDVCSCRKGAEQKFSGRAIIHLFLTVSSWSSDRIINFSFVISSNPIFFGGLFLPFIETNAFKKLSIEKFLPDYTIDKIRKKYPNAKIAGWIKELWVGPPYDYEHPKHKARIDFLNECDSVITNRPQLKEFQQIAYNLNKPFNFVAQPHNIDYFYLQVLHYKLYDSSQYLKKYDLNYILEAYL